MALAQGRKLLGLSAWSFPMRDHTYNGVPVAQMATSDIHDCLRNGIRISESDGLTTIEAIKVVLERLELELFIRENNLRGEHT